MIKSKHQRQREARAHRITDRIPARERARAEMWRRVEAQKAEHEQWCGRLIAAYKRGELPELYYKPCS